MFDELQALRLRYTNLINKRPAGEASSEPTLSPFQRQLLRTRNKLAIKPAAAPELDDLPLFLD